VDGRLNEVRYVVHASTSSRLSIQLLRINGFGTISYFLEIANVGEAYLIFEKISVFRNCFRQTAPTD